VHEPIDVTHDGRVEHGVDLTGGRHGESVEPVLVTDVPTPNAFNGLSDRHHQNSRVTSGSTLNPPGAESSGRDSGARAPGSAFVADLADETLTLH
jgi:hypothetical protein